MKLLMNWYVITSTGRYIVLTHVKYNKNSFTTDSLSKCVCVSLCVCCILRVICEGSCKRCSGAQWLWPWRALKWSSNVSLTFSSPQIFVFPILPHWFSLFHSSQKVFLLSFLHLPSISVSLFSSLPLTLSLGSLISPFSHSLFLHRKKGVEEVLRKLAIHR